MNTTEFAFLKLEAIAPSPTNPRKHFDAAKLTELTNSIKSGGVHQPILVRPLPGSRLEDTEREVEFEIVSGERRWRASLDAGQTKIPAMVRVLDDAQVLEIQMVENLQRADLSPMEEAQGYETLIDRTGITVDELVVKIGKSRAYIYARLKLLDLNADSQLALQEGKIDASRALLIARISDASLHAKALAEAMRKDHHGDVISLRSFQNWLRANVMLRLDRAPFPIADASLCPKAGNCHDCKKRNKAFTDLLSEVSPHIDGDLCLDPECYHQKEQAHALILEAGEEDESIRAAPIDSKESEPEPTKCTLHDELETLKHFAQKVIDLDVLTRIHDATMDALMDANTEKIISSHEEILRIWLIGKLEKTAVWDMERILGLIVTKDTEDAQRIKAVRQRLNLCRTEKLYLSAIVHMIYDELPSLDDKRAGNYDVLLTVAKTLGVDDTAIKKQVQDEVREEYAARIQEIQARIDAESGSKNETKPVPVKRTPRLKADEAQAGIAAAMQAAIPEKRAPADFAIDQRVRVTTDLERLRVKNHSYSGKTGVILSSFEGDNTEWVVKFSTRGKRLFRVEELEKA
jgi:ParB/RepB/Spo0J family partition protein